MRAPTIPVPTTRAGEFREAFLARPRVADGGMSWMLRARRALVNRSMDELNLSLPALVRDVHQEFLRAGAEILRTNTSGANRPRLEAFGYAERVRAVNQAGVRIAREAAREQAFIAGVVGPLGAGLEPVGALSAEAARVLFREQTDALVYAGVDLLMLEAFSDLGELEQAVAAARESAGAEMVVMAGLRITLDERLGDGRLADGTPVVEAARRIEEWAVDGIGAGCGAGPTAVLAAVEAMGGSTNKALSAMPDAGARVAPEYMARYAARFLRAGVRVLGGCCGVGPEHVRAMAGEVRAAGEGEASVRSLTVTVQGEEEAVGADAQASAEKSGLGVKLDSRRFVTLVEIAAPRGSDASLEIEMARRAKELGADAVVVVEGPGARLSAAVAAQLIAQRAGIETVLPVRGVGIRELLDADALGIRNLLCDSGSVALMVRRLNAGFDLGGNSLGSRTGLLAGVMVDPSEEEMAGLEGADFVVTRPVYDVEMLKRFLERCSLPVIVGMRPLKSLRDAEFTIHELGVAVPKEIVARLVEEGAGVTIAREMVERVRVRIAGVYWSGSFAGELH